MLGTEGPPPSRARRSLGARLSLSLLLVFGPFYFYPWKPLVHWGSFLPYATAFRNFREQHTDTANLALHMICLLSQLTGNFGLLCALDVKLMQHIHPPYKVLDPTLPLGLRAISLFSAGLWLIVLLCTPTAGVVKCVAVLLLAAVYIIAPLLHPVMVETGTYALFLFTAIACALLVPRTHVLIKRIVPLALGLSIGFATFELAAALAGADGGWDVVGLNQTAILARAGAPWRTSHVLDHRPLPPMILFATLVFTSCLSKPLAPTILCGFLGTRLVYLLTGEPLLWWLHLAFFATLFQKFAHELAVEASTLEREEAKGGDGVVANEWAHVTLFPALLLQAVYDQLYGIEPPPNASVQERLI
jgi:hypothetical protein